MPRRRSGRRTEKGRELGRTARAPTRPPPPLPLGAAPAAPAPAAAPAHGDPQREVAFARRPVVGYQRWDEILFLHWAVPPAVLRPLVDARLELDLLDGRAWVSLTPFTLRGGRLRFLPPLPLVSGFLELNLRTYVRAGGVPGLWFLSLDAASATACALARGTLGLPYFPARMRRSRTDGQHEFRSARLPPATPASFAARWTAGAPVAAPPGTLDHFLAERYALYSTLAGALVRVRVRHAPWELREAALEGVEQSVTRAAGIAAVEGPPIARCSRGADVAVLAPELPGASGRRWISGG